MEKPLSLQIFSNVINELHLLCKYRYLHYTLHLKIYIYLTKADITNTTLSGKMFTVSSYDY